MMAINFFKLSVKDYYPGLMAFMEDLLAASKRSLLFLILLVAELTHQVKVCERSVEKVYEYC